MTYGGYRGSNFTYSSSVEYYCNRGYKLVGQSHRSCQADRHWNASLPLCKAISCPSLTTPAWSLRNSSNFTYASVVGYTCARGFHLVGSSVLSCAWTGQWLGTLPECRPIECKPPNIPLHMALRSLNLTFSGKARYHCKTGYTAKDSLVQYCLDHGGWSAINERCAGVYIYKFRRICTSITSPLGYNCVHY